jgi:hypothetical protein
VKKFVEDKSDKTARAWRGIGLRSVGNPSPKTELSGDKSPANTHVVKDSPTVSKFSSGVSQTQIPIRDSGREVGKVPEVVGDPETWSHDGVEIDYA